MSFSLLNFSDILIVIIYFIISFGLGISLRKRGSTSLNNYFLSGRKTPWWIAGTGMVATTFAADTPLAVTGFVGNNGIAGNWIWWSQAIGGMLTVFFFAKLWRRSGVLTDVEFTELRYGGSSAAFLRGFKSIYFGLVMNLFIIGWVNLAMLKILQILQPDAHPELLLIACALITALYVSVSGLWGVAVTDMFQFTVAMGGCILLAYFAVSTDAVGGVTNLKNTLPKQALNFYPLVGSSQSGTSLGYHITLGTFLAFTTVQWWASWYPGAEPGGGGYIAQRIMSSKSEADGFFATLWFVIANYCIRPWPWIIAALAALVLYPSLSGGLREESYVYLIRDYLPSPLKGVLLAAFLGAYMSTLSTQMNWGSSYLINDFYKRFLVKDRTEKHYLLLAKFVTFLLLALALLLTFTVLESIGGTWALILEFGAGSGAVLILRWWWWRISALSEILSMVVPAVSVLMIRLFFMMFIKGRGLDESWFLFPTSLFLIVGVTLVVTLGVTLMTPPETKTTLEEFVKRVNPPGPGWSKVRLGMGLSPSSSEPLLPMFVGWISGTILVYSVLFATGSFLLGDRDALIYYLPVVALSGFVVVWIVKHNFAESDIKV